MIVLVIELISNNLSFQSLIQKARQRRAHWSCNDKCDTYTRNGAGMFE